MMIRDLLFQQNPHALFYPERYHAALVGMTLGFGPRPHPNAVAVYSREKLIDVLAAEFAADVHNDEEDLEASDHRADAEEWADTNGVRLHRPGCAGDCDYGEQPLRELSQFQNR
jgi:hypothetical protein